MTIQDLHVGDKLLVKDTRYESEFAGEYEVLDIRAGYAKLNPLNDIVFWTNDISHWTLIEKLVDGKEKMARQEKYNAYRKEFLLASIPHSERNL